MRGPGPAGHGFEQILPVQRQAARSVTGALDLYPCADAASVPGFVAFHWLRVAGLGGEREEGFVSVLPSLLSAAVMGHRCDVGAAPRAVGW